MTYDVVFSLEAAAELVRIAGMVQPSAAVIEAADSIRRVLENDPRKAGHLLSEGLLYIDLDPLRAFFMIDDDAMLVKSRTSASCDG